MRPSKLALTVLVLLLALHPHDVGQAAQAPRERALLPFRAVREEGRATRYVLGANRFTRSQLAEFVVGVDRFLTRARGVPPGRQAVWRVDGLRGYIALSTSPFAEGPEFLLTMQGEGIRPIQDENGVLAMASLLGLRLLEPERERPRPSLTPEPYLVP